MAVVASVKSDVQSGDENERLVGQAGPVVDVRNARTAKRWICAGLILLISVATIVYAELPHHGTGDSMALPRLTRIRPDEITALFDPLSTAAAGRPGMPMGKDDDTSYLVATPGTPALPGSSGAVPGAPSSNPVSHLAPATCANNEELHLGLCYKKCAILTNGTFPHRSSAFNCCKELSFFSCILPSEVDFKGIVAGSGYVIDGHGLVPHPPGSCYDDEENYLDMCYMKCSSLTFGDYPLRAGPNTCCKTAPCWNIFNLMTNGGHCSGYGVGGDQTKDGCPHSPRQQKKLT